MGSLQFWTLYVLVNNVQYCHRWRIVTEEKTKVVTTVWGTELIPFLAALAIMQKYDLKKGLNSSYSSYRPGAIHPFDLFLILSRCSSFYSLNCPGAKQLALQGIESILSPKPQRRPCPFFYVFLLFLRVLPSICSVGTGEGGVFTASNPLISLVTYVYTAVLLRVQELLVQRKEKLKLTEAIMIEKTEEELKLAKYIEAKKRREHYCEKELIERIVFDKEPPKKWPPHPSPLFNHHFSYNNI